MTPNQQIEGNGPPVIDRGGRVGERCQWDEGCNRPAVICIEFMEQRDENDQIGQRIFECVCAEHAVDAGRIFHASIDTRASLAAAEDTDCVDGWRGIATAPKDGRPVLVWRSPWEHAARASWNEDAWFVRKRTTKISPTHWLPLPDPPAEDKGERCKTCNGFRLVDTGERNKFGHKTYAPCPDCLPDPDDTKTESFCRDDRRLPVNNKERITGCFGDGRDEKESENT